MYCVSSMNHSYVTYLFTRESFLSQGFPWEDSPISWVFKINGLRSRIIMM